MLCEANAAPQSYSIILTNLLIQPYLSSSISLQRRLVSLDLRIFAGFVVYLPCSQFVSVWRYGDWIWDREIMSWRCDKHLGPVRKRSSKSKFYFRWNSLVIED